MTQTIGTSVLQYKAKVFSSADTLRGAGVKNSEWPANMMPFFALALVESRLLRLRDQKLQEFFDIHQRPLDINNAEDAFWLTSGIDNENYGYHEKTALTGYSLKDVCAVPSGNFLNRLLTYVEGYDDETRRLLGVGYQKGYPKFMDFEGIASHLYGLPSSPLYDFAKKWSEIDFKALNNSEITTLEEHIKREWGDISAETAGEQYTPFDMIKLAGGLAELMAKRSDDLPIANIYDMTCGGGNFLFAMEDHLSAALPNTSVISHGQELNPQLYALAAIEARFRQHAKIEFGNTLTDDKFASKKFQVIFANPPYGGDWKDIQAQIQADATGRFDSARLPSTSDSQLLFLQHAHAHLADDSIGGFIVHSGSSLFSGDAGSGESETRKFLFQTQDAVEAIIQMPKGEFFNTGINTYMWVLNKNKPADRKNKVLLINAETLCSKLKKNLNMKNVEIDDVSRAKIVQLLEDFVDTPVSKVVSVDDIMYNNVSIQLTHVDETGTYVQQTKSLGDTFTLNVDGVTYDVQGGVLQGVDTSGDVKAFVGELNTKVKEAQIIEVTTQGVTYRHLKESNDVFENDSSLGGGQVAVKVKTSKSKSVTQIKVEAALDKVLVKDVEVTPYSSSDNQGAMDAFLKQWVTQPYALIEDGVKSGCEVNFNKFFPKKSEVKSVADAVNDLNEVNAKMRALDAQLAALGVK